MAYEIDKIEAKAKDLSEKLSAKSALNPDGKPVKVSFMIVVDDVTDPDPAVGYLLVLF